MQKNTPELLARHPAGSLHRKDERRQDDCPAFSSFIHSAPAASQREGSQIQNLIDG